MYTPQDLSHSSDVTAWNAVLFLSDKGKRGELTAEELNKLTSIAQNTNLGDQEQWCAVAVIGNINGGSYNALLLNIALDQKSYWRARVSAMYGLELDQMSREEAGKLKDLSVDLNEDKDVQDTADEYWWRWLRQSQH